jgi:hypothetical protein
MIPSAKNYRETDRDLAAAALDGQAKFVSVFDALCNDSGCLTQAPSSISDLLSWDYGHLTTNDARFAVDALRLIE